MYGRKVPIFSDALYDSYIPITKESLLSDPEDDFHKVVEAHKMSLENTIEQMRADNNVDEIKKHNYEIELEALKRDLLQKDKEANSQK